MLQIGLKYHFDYEMSYCYFQPNIMLVLIFELLILFINLIIESFEVIAEILILTFNVK